MATTTAPAVTTTQPFQKQLFNSLIYSNLPANMPNMVRLDTNSTVWFNNDGSINQLWIQRYAQSVAAAGTKYVAIDIEDSAIDIRNSSAAVVNSKIQTMVQIVNLLKQAAPGLQVGAYGFPFADYYPLQLYSTAVAYRNGTKMDDPGTAYWAGNGFADATARFTSLQRANDTLAPLLSVLDFAAPDLYTHVDLNAPGNMQNWQIYAAAAIQEARRVMPGKPVLPFLQPQYTPEMGKLAGTDIPTNYWLQEVKTVWNDADGAIVWGGWNAQGREVWNPSAGWYSVIADGSFKN
ncbi:MAG TPA: hypothetical protein VM008_21905 [Phycisphaerae bacterium]|nr:hypothetical protein [Phycisphaerae bacterium]